MTIFTCVQDWDAMLTCIYEAFSSGLGHQNIRLLLEPVEQYSLFDTYIHVEADPVKADQVMSSVIKKISPKVYRELAYSAMAYEEDVLDNIYHMLLLGFHFGPDVLGMVQFRDVMRHQEIRTRLGREVCRFKEILRFHEVGQEFYVAHIEPKSRLVIALGPSISDRMPSEHWMIIDDVHKEAVVHPRDSDFYLKKLTDLEYERLLETEMENDTFTDLWKLFFDTIAIEERANARCQRNLFPIWARRHAVEFL